MSIMTSQSYFSLCSMQMWFINAYMFFLDHLIALFQNLLTINSQQYKPQIELQSGRDI